MIPEFHSFNARMRKSPGIAFACGIFLCLFAGGIDYLDGGAWNFPAMYAVPVVWMAWVLGLVPGLSLGVLSVILSALCGPQRADPILGWSELGALAVFLALLAWLTALLRTFVLKQESLVRHDGLTGLYNARAFQEILERESHRCRRYNRPITIAYIDCDDFFEIGRRLGHQRADALLELTGKMISQGLRATDVLARMHSDEFIVVLPETHNRDAKNIFLRIRKTLADQLAVQDSGLTYSVGVVTFLSAPSDLGSMVETARQLTSRVKKNGKNGVETETVGAANLRKE